MARTCYICTFDEMMMRSTLSRPTLGSEHANHYTTNGEQIKKNTCS